MKKIYIKFISFLLLLSLPACGKNNQIVRFSEWNLIAPNSELLYSYSDKDRGFHGDGIDCYIFRFTPDYKDYINSYLKDHKTDFTYQESVLDLASDISQEVLQIDNTEIIDYFNSMKNINSALVLQKNDKLIIIVDENNEKITFVSSLY